MGDIKSATILKVIEKEWKQIPLVVRHFIVRALLLMVFWFLVYTSLLKPNAKLDDWLTKVTAQATTNCLNRFYSNGFTMASIETKGPGVTYVSIAQYISLHDKFAVFIVQRCNALELFATYIGFLICVPGTIKRKWVYTLIGVVLIFILNVARCMMLVWLNLNKPGWSDFAHHYVFTTVVYAFIFLLWVLFMKKPKTNEA